MRGRKISKQAYYLKAEKVQGYRSKFESTIALSLLNHSALYEKVKLPYLIQRYANYIPDWILPKQAIVIEAKGYFTSIDRTKMLIVKDQYPNLDIRLLFQRDNKLNSKSKTKYSDWANKYNFIYSIGEKVPEAWLKHQPSSLQQQAFDEVISKQLK